MKIDAKATLIEYQNTVQPYIEDFFEEYLPKAKLISPESREAIKILEEYTLRKAKRLRAALFFYTYLMMGGKKKQEAIKTSVFIEIIQSYLLIHDDVMDQDSLRRGKPTVHKVYEEIHKNKYGIHDPAHFGESMAINLGDIACHLGGLILSDAKFDADHKIRAISKFHKQIVTVGFGQMLDVLSSVKSVMKEQDVMKIHHYKTATYTYETPISVGAILAGATDKEVEILTNFAIPAGIAFQIQDDILGMFGDEEQLGKANISDLREGKKTMLILKALEKGTKEEVTLITQALGNKNVNQATADKVRDIIIRTGSLEHSKLVSRKYVLKAKKALAKMPDWNGKGRAFLDGVADYMIQRTY